MGSEGQYEGSQSQDDTQHAAGRTGLPRIWYHYYATLAFCVGTFAVGMITSWSSPMIRILGSDDSPVGKMDNLEISPLETLPAVAAIMGVLIFPIFLTKYGRKVPGYLGAACAIIGGIFLVTATNKYELYIGRFITGFAAIGLAMVGPIYLSEVCYPSNRGALITYTQFGTNSGSLVGFLLGTVCGYRMFTAFTLISPIIFPILFFWLPESPHYLLLQSKTSEAHDALLWYRGDSQVVTEELESVSKITPKKVSFRVLLQNRANRRVMIIIPFLFIFNIMSGGTVIMSYASKIFQESDSTLSPNTSAAILSTIAFFASLSSIFIIDRTGRRFLVISSFTGMSVALVVTSVYFYLNQVGSAVNNQGWIPIVSLSTFVAANTMGVGTAVEVIASEMLSPEVKPIAMGSLGLLATAFIFLSLQLYAIFVQYIGTYFNFLVEAIFSISAIFIFYFILPETKGKPITEIIDQLNRGGSNNQSQENITDNVSTISP